MLTGTYSHPDVGVHHLWYQHITLLDVAVHRGLESTSCARDEYPIGSANFGPSAKRDPSTRSPGKGEGATSDHQPGNGDDALTPWIPAIDMGFRYRTTCNVG